MKKMMLLFFISLPMTGFAQFYTGIQSGPDFFGAQDLKFKYYKSGGIYDHKVLTNDVEGSLNLLHGISAGYWFKGQKSRHWGVRGEWLNWDLTTSVDRNELPPEVPYNRFEQERRGFLLSLMYRKHIFSGMHLGSGPFYFYGGVGGGAVFTRVVHGTSGWNKGFQLLGGLSVPLRRHIQFHIEYKYLITHDADSYPKSTKGWTIDTSGTPTIFRFHPHMDTRFSVVLFGLQYAF